MFDEIHNSAVLESNPIPPVQVIGHTVLNFRFIPESYLSALGKQWDPGLDHLVYLRMLIEEETEEVLQ